MASSYYDFRTSEVFIIELGKRCHTQLAPGDAPTTCEHNRVIAQVLSEQRFVVKRVVSVDALQSDNNLEVCTRMSTVNKPAGVSFMRTVPARPSLTGSCETPRARLKPDLSQVQTRIALIDDGAENN